MYQDMSLDMGRYTAQKNFIGPVNLFLKIRSCLNDSETN